MNAEVNSLMVSFRFLLSCARWLKGEAGCRCVGVALACFQLLFSEFSFAQPVPHRPRPCIAVNTYGIKAKWGYIYNAMCPANHVFLATPSASTRSTDNPESITSGGICCPLPASDMLTDHSSRTGERCAEDSVAIGAAMSGDFACENCVREFICARINTDRYTLGPETEGRRVGFRSSLSDGSKLISQGDIPMSFRYGVGRVGQYTWQQSSCIGFPFGSVVTGKTSKYCNGRRFRQFLYRGSEGDPKRGTPVQIFPHCSMIFGIFSDQPICHEE